MDVPVLPRHKRHPGSTLPAADAPPAIFDCRLVRSGSRHPLDSHDRPMPMCPSHRSLHRQLSRTENIAGERNIQFPSNLGSQQHRCDSTFHIHGASAVNSVSFSYAGKRFIAPVCTFTRRNDVNVTGQKHRSATAGAVQPSCEIRTSAEISTVLCSWLTQVLS